MKTSRKELKFQAILYAISGFNSSIDNDMASLFTYTSVAIFITAVKKPLLPGYIVFIMSYYMRISSLIGFMFIRAITNSISANVSTKRIQVKRTATFPFRIY